MAEGSQSATRNSKAVTEEIRYCFEGEDVDHVSRNMAGIQMRRFPVMDRNKRLVGVISPADFATQGGRAQAEQALQGGSRSA
jgi:CBS domain-containing protein